MSKKSINRQKKYRTLSPKKRERSNYIKMTKGLPDSYSQDYVLTNQEEMDMLSRYILDYKNIETGFLVTGHMTGNQ